MSPVPDGYLPPPGKLPGTPVILTLPVGTLLWRVHSSTYGAIQFKPFAPQSPYQGGRFDATSDNDPYLYAGDSAECAIAEVWDRDIAPQKESRFVPKKSLHGRELSQLRIAADITLIDVSYPHASEFGQTAWLSTCDSHDYPHTRHWAAWLRTQAPGHSGLAWRSRRDQGRWAYVLYERQVPAGALVVVNSISVEKGAGLKVVRKALSMHNLVIK